MLHSGSRGVGNAIGTLFIGRVIEATKTVIRKSFQSHIEAVNCH